MYNVHTRVVLVDFNSMAEHDAKRQSSYISCPSDVSVFSKSSTEK